MKQSVSPPCLESSCDGCHVDTNNIYQISWRALPCIMPFGNNIDLSWNMSNWYLIRWLLNFDLLVADKFALLDLQNELTLDLVLDTADTWTLNLWRECFQIDDLVNFHTTCIAGIDCHLHAWLDITASCDDTLDIDERSNFIRLDFAHFVVVDLSVLPAWNDDQVVLAL